METRKTGDSAFCWQSKAARRAIRDAFDATSNVSTALCVYDALTEIASDEQREMFTTTHAWISRLSGVSPTTIKKVLPVLRDLGLVSISTPALRAPSTYTLHSVANDSHSTANDRQPKANDSHSASSVRQRDIFGSLATSEESQKNHRRITIAAPAKPVADERDQLFQALARAEGSDPTELTKTAARTIAVALSEIRNVCPTVTPAEIERRSRVYGAVMPGGTRLTASALAKHWARCTGRDTSKPTPTSSQDDQPPPQWRELLEADCPGNLINAEGKPWTSVPYTVRVRLWPQRYHNGSALNHAA